MVWGSTSDMYNELIMHSFQAKGAIIIDNRSMLQDC